jgi:hypothetical protein
MLLLAAWLVLACAALLRGSGRLYFGPPISDLTYCFYPWRVFLCRWLDRGVIPWWNPHVFGGYPVLEMQQMALFNPVSLLTALVLPPGLGLNVMMALHVALAGAATWVALRKALRLSPWAAATGAIVYVYNAVFATRVSAGHFTVVAACAVAPLGVAAVWRAAVRVCAEPRVVPGLLAPCAGGWIVAAAAANAFCVVAGAPQYVMYLIWMEFTACALAALRRPAAGAAVFACVWGAAALVSAPQWLPTLSYLPFSGRSQMSGAMGIILEFDWRIMLAELVFPFPLGDDVFSGHLHAKNVWETAGYPGALALILMGALVLDPRTFRRGGAQSAVGRPGAHRARVLSVAGRMAAGFLLFSRAAQGAGCDRHRGDAGRRITIGLPAGGGATARRRAPTRRMAHGRRGLPAGPACRRRGRRRHARSGPVGLAHPQPSGTVRPRCLRDLAGDETTARKGRDASEQRGSAHHGHGRHRGVFARPAGAPSEDPARAARAGGMRRARRRSSSLLCGASSLLSLRPSASHGGFHRAALGRNPARQAAPRGAWPCPTFWRI